MDDMKPNSGKRNELIDEYQLMYRQFQVTLSENFCFSLMSVASDCRNDMVIKFTDEGDNRGIVSSNGPIQFDKVWNFAEIVHKGYKRGVRIMPIVGLDNAICVCLYDNYDTKDTEFSSPNMLNEATVVLSQELVLGTTFMLRFICYLLKEYEADDVFSTDSPGSDKINIH